MKLIDEKGRLFGLINIIDLIVAVLVLALVAGGGYKLRGANQSTAEVVSRQVVVTALISEVRQPTVDAIKIGDMVRDPISKAPLGTIIDLEVQPFRKAVETADGKIVLAQVPEKFDIMMKLEAWAVISDIAVSVGANNVHVGAQLPMRTKDYSVVGTVFKVEEME